MVATEAGPSVCCCAEPHPGLEPLRANARRIGVSRACPLRRAARASSIRARYCSRVIGRQINIGTRWPWSSQARRCPAAVQPAILAPGASGTSGRERPRRPHNGSAFGVHHPSANEHWDRASWLAGRRGAAPAWPATTPACDTAHRAASWAFSTASGPATRGYAHGYKPVGAAAVLRAHGQDGYLGECIRGERTALQQAVQPNGTNKSLTVTLAVMRHSQGIIGEGRLGGAGR